MKIKKPTSLLRKIIEKIKKQEEQEITEKRKKAIKYQRTHGSYMNRLLTLIVMILTFLYTIQKLLQPEIEKAIGLDKFALIMGLNMIAITCIFVLLDYIIYNIEGVFGTEQEKLREYIFKNENMIVIVISAIIAWWTVRWKNKKTTDYSNNQ